MSKESAKKFLNLAENNAAFKKKLQAHPTPKGKREFAKEQNLSFSKKELNNAIEEKYNFHLSNSDMKKIAAAGGTAQIVSDVQPSLGGGATRPRAAGKKPLSNKVQEAINSACEATQD